jgi:hypothetical protein
MPDKLEAGRLLTELQQAAAAFRFRGKAHPSKSLQQILLEAEGAYKRCAYNLVFHLVRVGNCLIARERPIFKQNSTKWIQKIRELRETILIHEQKEARSGAWITKS